MSDTIVLPRQIVVEVLRRMMQDALQINSEWGVGEIDWAGETEIANLAQCLGLKSGEWPDD